MSATSAPHSPGEPEGDRDALRRAALRGLLRMALVAGAFLLALALVSWTFRGPIEQLGRAFVDRFGALGMAFGAFLADGGHFPLPPQFYLLAAVAAGHAPAVAMAAVLAGSVLGGLSAFALARRAQRWERVERWSRAPRVVVERLVRRHGLWGLALAGMMPLSYWLLCVSAGVLSVPYRGYAVLALTRGPRLVFSYFIIVLAWEGAPR